MSQCLLDSAPISEPERVMLRFVETLTRHAYKATDEEVAGLRAAGWSDEQIGECVYITALFAFFNRVADAFGLEDPGYFSSPPPLVHRPETAVESSTRPGAQPPCPPTE